MTVEIPLANFFWGERYASLRDPFGHVWGLASRSEDLSATDIQNRSNQWFSGHSS